MEVRGLSGPCVRSSSCHSKNFQGALQTRHSSIVHALQVFNSGFLSNRCSHSCQPLAPFKLRTSALSQSTPSQVKDENQNTGTSSFLEKGTSGKPENGVAINRNGAVSSEIKEASTSDEFSAESTESVQVSPSLRHNSLVYDPLPSDSEDMEDPKSRDLSLAPISELTPQTPLGLWQWVQEEALPFLKAVVELRIQEDPEIPPKEPPEWPETQKGVLMGWAIVEQDKLYFEALATYIQWWADSWRIPLQPNYDSLAAEAYFSRRPHLIVFRLAQVSVALGIMALRVLRDNRIASWQSSPAELARRRRATATRLKHGLVALGPTFIKVAQSLSSRPDIIGPDSARVLSSLQDRLPPFPTKIALKILQEELTPNSRVQGSDPQLDQDASPLSPLFSHLSREPVAAASFGQVYRGRTVQGDDVAVKVQRPEVLLQVARDILILRILLGWVRQLAKVNSDIRVLADELGRGLYGELDYRLEARNTDDFRRAHAHLRTVDVPRIFPELTTRKVLTMEWMEGERPSDLLDIARSASNSQRDRQLARAKLLRLVSIGVESSLVQLLESGVMHADPHPGNLLLTPNGHVAYLDFGLLTVMQRSHQAAMLAAIAHLVNGEWAPLAADLADMDVLKPHTDRTAVTRALEEAFAQNVGTTGGVGVGGGVPNIRFGQVTNQLWQIALKFRFKLPPYYTLVLRSLASLEGIGLSVDPDFKVFAAAYPYVVRKLLTDSQETSRKVLRELLLTAEGRFRWDRLAALAASSREAQKAKRAAFLPWTGGESPLALPDGDEPKSQGAALMELLLSSEAASARRVLLEANTVALAQAFVSREASPLRRRISSAIFSLTFSGDNLSQNQKLSKNSAKQKAQSKRLWFLGRTMIKKLKGNFFLKLRVFWTAASIILSAIFLKIMSVWRHLNEKNVLKQAPAF